MSNRDSGPISPVDCHRHLLGALELQAKASFSVGSWHRLLVTSRELYSAAVLGK